MNTKPRTKLFNLTALILVLSLMMPWAAFADTVTNNVIAGGNDTIIAGKSTSISFTLNATGNDGQNGCNATGNQPATMTINKSAAVTAPPSIQLAGCGNPIPVLFSSNTPGNYPISVTVTGGRGGTYDVSAASFTLRVLPSDSTPPDLSLPGSITAEATSAAGAVVTYSASATDAVDGTVAIACSPASGATFPLGTTTVNCSAKDSKNNTATGSFTVAVVDTTPPEIANTPANMTVEAESAAGAVVSYSNPIATDLVSGNVAVSCSPASGSTFSLGDSHTVTCTATDARGNSSTSTFTILVEDTTSPVLVVGDVTEEATGPNGADVNYTATANDLVDGQLTPSCTPASGTRFALRTTEVSCTVTDSAGNSAFASFNVTVQDTVAPVIAPHGAVEAEATGPNGAVVSYSSPATSDAVDGNGVATCVPASGSQFPLGTTTVTCTAKDAAGNEATPITFPVVVVDTTPPTVTVPANKTVEATGPSGAVVTFSATASDIVDGAVSVSCLPASGATFGFGTKTVTCSASDSRNNIGSASFVVTVVDTTAPSLTLPANITQEATGPNGTAVSYSASASDLVDGLIAPNCSPASGSTFALGTTTVNCSVTDSRSNTATGSFTVKVQDTTAPTNVRFNGISNGASFYWGDLGSTMPASWTCSADDAVGATCSISGYSSASGTHTLTATAKDAAGNTTTATLYYEIKAWTFKGFYQPVDMNGVYNTVKGGSTVPFKFEVFKGSAELSDTSTATIKSLTAKQVTCSAAAAIDDIELTATGGTSLRYDSTAGQYVYNWQTPKGPVGSCYSVTISSADGSSATAFFKLK
jgi:large repetitive protein